jgi:hypothetical protein
MLRKLNVVFKYCKNVMVFVNKFLVILVCRMLEFFTQES